MSVQHGESLDRYRWIVNAPCQICEVSLTRKTMPVCHQKQFGVVWNVMVTEVVFVKENTNSNGKPCETTALTLVYK